MQDYEVAAMELADLYNKTGIKCEVGKPRFSVAPLSKLDGGKPWPHFSYTLTFSSANSSASMAVEWHHGASKEEQYSSFGERWPKASNKPKPHEVMGEICDEAIDAHSQSFDDWAGSFGYSTDRREAERIYRLCSDRYHELTRLLTESEIKKMAELAGRL